jgi:hypothetical protein
MPSTFHPSRLDAQKIVLSKILWSLTTSRILKRFL